MSEHFIPIKEAINQADAQALKQAIISVWDNKEIAKITPLRLKIFLAYLGGYRLTEDNIAHFPLNPEEMKRYLKFIGENEQ
jgi:hypothetical protein